MPEPRVTRIPLTPHTLLIVHVTRELAPEAVLPFAAELHQQTGLPVLLLDDGAAVTVSERDQSAAALRDALRVQGPTSAADVLEELDRMGWELVQLRRS